MFSKIVKFLFRRPQPKRQLPALHAKPAFTDTNSQSSSSSSSDGGGVGTQVVVTVEQQSLLPVTVPSAGVLEDISYLETCSYPIDVGVILSSDNTLLKVLCLSKDQVLKLIEESSYVFDTTNGRQIKHRGVGVKRAMVARLSNIVSIDFDDLYFVDVDDAPQESSNG